MVAVGPAWTVPGLGLAAGRNPLAVERHVMAMAAELVPGVITVTPHARYYSLHGLVADEVTRRELRVEQAQSLVRRCEVVLAVASWIHHSGRPSVLGKAHGTDNLVRRLTAGVVDLGEASLPVAPAVQQS